MSNLSTIQNAASTRRAITLDALQTNTYDELVEQYCAAVTPRSLHAADGKHAGRMLAWRGLGHGWLARRLRALALSPTFLWEGKTLAADSDTQGSGYNRICLEGVLGRQHLFPFDTRFGTSLFDGKPTIIIDYDRPANPWYMRRIHDEIRELEPGLFLGLDIWKSRHDATGLVWFALDGRRRLN
jgi:hypothetical protein